MYNNFFLASTPTKSSLVLLLLVRAPVLPALVQIPSLPPVQPGLPLAPPLGACSTTRTGRRLDWEQGDTLLASAILMGIELASEILCWQVIFRSLPRALSQAKLALNKLSASYTF
jgi:hypothetical protein